MSFGDNLKRLRRDKGWTQGDLADKAGLKMTHIPRLEKDNTDPKLSTIYRLINALGCSSDTLLMDAEKVGVDGLLKASLERIQQLPETHKYILIDIIDAYCIRNSVQSSFKHDNQMKIMLYKDKPQSLVREEDLEKEIRKK